MSTQLHSGSFTPGKTSPSVPAKLSLALAAAAFALLSARPAGAQATTCAPAGSQASHDADLAADCAAGLCVERVCVDTLYRRAIICGRGFAGSPTVTVGGKAIPVLSSLAGACGATDEAMLVGLDDCNEGQHKLVVYNATLKSEPFFIKVGELAGPQGPRGATGATGAQGPTGATGPQGPKGDKGDTGPMGNTGLTGAAGATGPAGAQGAKGDKGDTGPMGAPGTNGANGAPGTNGANGAPGINGADGAPGATGPAGPAGTSNLSVSTALYTVHSRCTTPGVITLDGSCAYTAAATATETDNASTVCPPLSTTSGSVSYSIAAAYTTPTTCAAQCAGVPAAPRTACVAYTHQCAHLCSTFYSRDCLVAQPQCTTNGTATDLTCNCDNTLLGYLAK